MLQTKTVQPELLELLRKLMNVELLKNFALVGGTSLALQIGHRNSVDIDLFGVDYLTDLDISDVLINIGNYKFIKKSRVINIVDVNGIKVDFVTYNYPWLVSPMSKDGIRLACKKDIAAMKLNAISGRGSKKDFIDLYFLLKEFTLGEIISFYLEKFHDGSEFLVLRSLAYFVDADSQPMPKMFNQVSWPEMKEDINSAYDLYIKKLK